MYRPRDTNNKLSLVTFQTLGFNFLKYNLMAHIVGTHSTKLSNIGGSGFWLILEERWQ